MPRYPSPYFNISEIRMCLRNNGMSYFMDSIFSFLEVHKIMVYLRVTENWWLLSSFFPPKF